MQERERRQHEVKTWPDYFQAMKDGRKTFEYRRNDRDYRPGDVLHSREWDPETRTYTGRERLYLITYVMTEGFELPENRCIMSTVPMDATIEVEFTEPAPNRY